MSYANVLVAIPAYNEELYIKKVIEEARKYAPVVVVDDGSNDKTAEIAASLGTRVISHKVNRGYGAAIQSCFAYALEQKADVLITIDGDGQHYPGDIPRLLDEFYTHNCDVVIGSRFLGSQENMPEYRKAGIKIINWLANFACKTSLTDYQSGFRCYGKRALSLPLKNNCMSVSVEFLIKARREGLIVREIPIKCYYHRNSSTYNPVIHGFTVALSTILLRIKNLC